jgi:hypothetical protein
MTVQECHSKESVLAVWLISSITGRKSAYMRHRLAAKLHPGSTVSHPHHRAAPIKTTLSFQNLEAALPAGIPAGEPIQQPVRSANPGIGLHWFNSGGLWTVRMEGSRIVFPALEKRSCEVWMQCEPYCPRIILGDTPPKAKQREECPHIRAACGEEGAKYRDSSMRTGRACMSTPSLVFCALNRPSHPAGAADIRGLT